MLKKIFNFTNIWFLIFLVSLLYIKELNYLYFDSTQSADFGKYFSYFEYYFNVANETFREQGTFYYYLHSLNFYRYGGVLNESNFFFLLSKSVQEINFFIYAIGLLGYFYLLRFFKFKKIHIFATFTVLNFFPLLIAMLITFKPEILVFALLPWILLCLEKFNKDKSIISLFIGIPILVVAITTKGSALGMLGAYLFLTNINLLKKLNFKNFVILLLSFVTLFLIVSIHDYQINNASILEVKHDEKYNNKADFDLLYNFNFVKIVKSPVKHNHASSFVGLTLLDTFGDYFDIYWNNDSSLYYKNRSEVLIITESDQLKAPVINIFDKTITVNAQYLTDIYLTSSMGLLLSLIFYFSLFRNLFIKSRYKKFIFAPLVGIVLILVQSILGFPQNNWDPEVGDSIKPYYYGFFICLSLIFLIVKQLKTNRVAYFLIPLFILISMNILGFPKTEERDYVNEIEQVNSFSSFCQLNTLFFNDLNNFKTSSCNNLEVTKRTTYSEFNNFVEPPRLQLINLFILGILLSALIAISRKEIFPTIKN